jgi:hypothetical protein
VETDTLTDPDWLESVTWHAPVVWDDIVATVRPILEGDIAFVEHGDVAQLAHFGTGIKVTVEDDELLLSSSYSLLGGDASIVADRMRELAFALEMVSGRTAVAVRFDQPELVSGDIAGRHRVHGYALFAHEGVVSERVERTMSLHRSFLPEFDAHVARRNP